MGKPGLIVGIDFGTISTCVSSVKLSTDGSLDFIRGWPERSQESELKVTTKIAHPKGSNVPSLRGFEAETYRDGEDICEPFKEFLDHKTLKQ